MAIKEKDKIYFLSLIEAKLNIFNIDWKELGNDDLGSPYRNLRPYGGDCECWGGTPEEEKEWHVTHLNKCIKSYKQLGELRESLWNLITQESKRFKKEKKKVWERIKEKAHKLGLGDISGKWEIMNCTNKKLLKDKEDSKLVYLEKFANTWQKNSETEKERIRQEQQKTQAEETQQKEQEFKRQTKEEERRESNPKSDEELNGLKTKFHKIYQKGKKYKQIELMMMLDILGEIEKETGLDNNLQDAKNELQIIQDKIEPYQHAIYVITTKGEKVDDMLKGLNKHELESGKKALEETKKIISLSERDEYLLNEINDRLKVLNLEEEIEQLKNNKAANPQQQEENQKKITEKEKELGEIKKDKEKKQEAIIQEITNLKTQIQQTLKSHNLKTSDLPPKYQNWEEQLTKLKSKEEINSLVTELNQQIKNKLEELKRKQNQKSNKQQPISLSTKLFIGGGTALIVSVFLMLIIKRKKIRRRKQV